MNKLTAFYMIFFLLTSCECLPLNKKNTETFESAITAFLMESYKVEGSRKEYLNSNKAVQRPFYTYQNLMRFTSYSPKGQEAYCLNYQIPLKGKTSDLVLLKLDEIRFSCKEVSNRSELSRLKDIKNLKLFFILKKLQRTFKASKIKPFEFVISFNKNKKNIRIKLPLINVRPNQVFIEGEQLGTLDLHKKSKYKSSSENTFLNGSKLIRNVESYVNHSLFLGKKDDNYADHTSVQCQKVLKGCSINGASECHRCRYGWYEVIDQNCIGGGSRYCGASNCGERGMPACLRGREIVKTKNKKEAVCFENSPFGYCQKGLRTSCDGNGVLICL